MLTPSMLSGTCSAERKITRSGGIPFPNVRRGVGMHSSALSSKGTARGARRSAFSFSSASRFIAERTEDGRVSPLPTSD